VVIFQENRSPDNLFHDQTLINRGADIALQGTNSTGATIPLQPTSLTQNYDLSHRHDAFLAQYDNGKMDGADLVNIFCPPGSVNCPCSQYAMQNGIACPLPNPQFYYIDPAEVQPYFTLAETYTFGDNTFQNNQGPSFPAHQYIISGTSTMGTNAPGGNANLFIAENTPNGIAGRNTSGCAVAATTLVSLIDITNPDPTTNETQSAYPCAEHPTLIDVLDTNKISWKYYAPSPVSIWTGPNAIQHLCGPNVAPPNATSCTSADWTNNVIQPNNAQILTDISSGNLAAVSWVIPTGQASDHNIATDGSGPSWVASIVNAIGNSQYWQDTAIIITWDDWGGWYDHVAPQLVLNNSYEQGFRVPLIVVSPYAKAAYISKVHHDFGSILKFIETTFSLPAIDPNGTYADSHADNLSDCFDFTQTPLKFATVAAPLKADYFLNNKEKALDPDDD
jgi:phospholipase C